MDNENLIDNSSYELKFDKSTGLAIIKDSIPELNNVQYPVKLIESDNYWKKTINLIMIALATNTDEIFELLLEKNCNIPFIDLFICLLNEHKSFGKLYFANVHNYIFNYKL